MCALTHRPLVNQQIQEGGTQAISIATDNDGLNFLATRSWAWSWGRRYS